MAELTSPVERLTQALADRYTIERELGAGGMATVYLAHDIRHDPLNRCSGNTARKKGAGRSQTRERGRSDEEIRALRAGLSVASVPPPEGESA